MSQCRWPADLTRRAQFLCIEIARNREGVNDSAVLRAELLVDELMERKVKLKVAISEPGKHPSRPGTDRVPYI